MMYDNTCDRMSTFVIKSLNTFLRDSRSFESKKLDGRSPCGSSADEFKCL